MHLTEGSGVDILPCGVGGITGSSLGDSQGKLSDQNEAILERSGRMAQFPTIFPEKAPSLDTAFPLTERSESQMAGCLAFRWSLRRRNDNLPVPLCPYRKVCGQWRSGWNRAVHIEQKQNKTSLAAIYNIYPGSLWFINSQDKRLLN